jgi:hypothetical protein
MPAVETLQQANMFTGQWETKRTRNVLHQMPMFSANETFAFGVRVRPYLWAAGKPTLELEREDVRTPEEIERDLMREAEARTPTMFTDAPPPNGVSEAEGEARDTGNGHEPPETPAASGEVTQYSAYRALVTLVREQAETLWVDSAYRQRYYNQLPLSIQAAQSVGLTASEISAAMQIGEFLGNQERQSAEHTPRVIYDASDGNETSSGEAANSALAPPTSPLSPQPAISGVEPREGLHARLRREQIPVRTRQPKPMPQEAAPLEWMEREHIQKRLPYLAEGIARLDEDELAALAANISEVLQETYWTILGITIAHYLDHEQGEQGEGQRPA